MSDNYSNTRTKVAEYFYNRIRKNSTREKVDSFRFENVKSIGIIFDNNHEGLNDFIKDISQEFRSRSGVISIFQLAYKIEDNNKPEPNGIPVVYFNDKDLNWYGKSKYKDVTNFLDTPFDLLINLAENDTWAIKFCSLLSKSKFKVGKFQENEVVYDLMINNKEKDNKVTFKLILDTLKIINN